MTTITTRTNKQSELSWVEGDANLDIDVKTASSDPSVGADDNRAIYECTGTFDFTLPVAATIVNPPTTNNNDWEITIKNVGTGVIRPITQSTDKIDGTGPISIQPNECYTLKVNNAKDGYISTASGRPTWRYYTELSTHGTSELGIASSIPVGVLGIRFDFFAVQSTDNIFIQLGDANDYASAGDSNAVWLSGGSLNSDSQSTGPYVVTSDLSAGQSVTGIIEFSKHGTDDNWAGSGNVMIGSVAVCVSAGNAVMPFPSDLSRAKVTSTGTFSSGEVSVYIFK